MRPALGGPALLAGLLGTIAALSQEPGPAPRDLGGPDEAPTLVRPARRPARLQTPDDATLAAALDATVLAATVDPYELARVRYQSLHNVPVENRAAYKAQVDLALNRLSRKKDLALTVAVGPDGVALRVDLDAYGIDPAEYDRLGDVDPYFHLKVIRKQFLPALFVGGALTVPAPLGAGPPPPALAGAARPVRDPPEVLPWPGGKWPSDGKTYAPGEFTYTHDAEAVRKCVAANPGHPTWAVPAAPAGVEPVVRSGLPAYDPLKDKVEATPAAPGLTPDAVVALAAALRTNTPLLRADWFVVNATRQPFYTRLLGTRTLADAEKLAAFSRAVEAVDETQATVIESGSHGLCRPVARNNRLLARTRTPWGRFWQTFDYKESVGQRNVVNNFLNKFDGKKFRDGGEYVYSLPNGLDGYFLVNGQDQPVDEVPIEIAIDSLALDARVRQGRSCIWCHKNGIQPFKSDFQLQLDPGGLDDLLIRDHHYDAKTAARTARRIQELFGAPDWAQTVRDDNKIYEGAVRRVANLSAPAAAGVYKALYDDYEETALDLGRIVWDVGLSEEDCQAAMRTRLDGVSNGVLLRPLKAPALPIRRDQWEESYQDFQLRLVGWLAARRPAGHNGK